MGAEVCMSPGSVPWEVRTSAIFFFVFSFVQIQHLLLGALVSTPQRCPRGCKYSLICLAAYYATMVYY